MSDDLGSHIGKMGSVAGIEAINRSTRTALLDTGETIPITDWFKMGGYNCAPSEAVACVAGPCSNGKWYLIDLREYERIILQ